MTFNRFLFQSLLGVCATSVAFNASAEVRDTRPFQSKALNTVRAAQSDRGELVSSIIVKVKASSRGVVANEVRSGKANALSSKVDTLLKIRRNMSGGAHVVDLPQPMTLAEARALASSLIKDSDIEYAEPDLRMLAQGTTPSDPGFSRQWNLDSPSPTNIGGLDMPPLWSYGRGSPTVTVAVVDTGVISHADLGQLLQGYDFISDEKYANDGDGRDDNATDPGDWNSAGECGVGSTAERSSWHGTHIAGIIAAQMNNGLGGVGVAPNVRILPVRVLGKCGGAVSDVVDGIRWAAGLSIPGVALNPNPAQVINVSLGADGFCSASYAAAINDVRAAGKVVVVSTGNEGQKFIGQPANCPGVIAVTAHGLDGDNSEYSNVGAGTTVSAPGGGCSTTARKNGTCGSFPGIYSLGNTGTQAPSVDSYATKVGTSMAAAHVSGVVAMMYSVNPTLKPDQVTSVLSSTVRPHPSSGVCVASIATSSPASCGAGLVNANASVEAVSGNPVVTVTPSSQVVLPGATLSIKATAAPTVWHSINTKLWSTGQDNPQSVTLQNGSTDIVTFTLSQKGRYTFVYTVTQDDGKVGSATAEVIANTPLVVDVVPEQLVTTKEALSTQIKATDADGDKLNYIAVTVPQGATLSPEGMLTWPSAGAPGNYPVEVHITDGVNVAKTVSFNIRVNPAIQTDVTGGTSGDNKGGGGSIDLWMIFLLVSGAVAIKGRYIRIRK